LVNVLLTIVFGKWWTRWFKD